MPLLTSCADIEKQPQAEDKAEMALVLKPAGFDSLPGWDGDHHDEVLKAFEKSCARILKRAPSDKFGPTQNLYGDFYGDWQPACKALLDNPGQNAKAYFTKWFTPFEARFENGETNGLFTGYYEASLNGSRVRSERYNIPLHARPDDLVMVDLGEFREHLKGERIAGRVTDGRLRPYESREDIVGGNWPHNDKVLVWVDDAVDAFFVQIQGSGLVRLDDGSLMRIGYAGQNGHPYYAIGRELVKIGAMDKESVSMQSIRDWLSANPDQADEIMNTNKSYVFFRELDGDGPVGGEGLPLTAERSIAIDRTKIAYGTPLWVDIDHPSENQPNLQKLMVAQDTGGAIRGAVRGDYFWGYGERAETLAGAMKSQGRYWLLLPKDEQ